MITPSLVPPTLKAQMGLQDPKKPSQSFEKDVSRFTIYEIRKKRPGNTRDSI